MCGNAGGLLLSGQEREGPYENRLRGLRAAGHFWQTAGNGGTQSYGAYGICGVRRTPGPAVQPPSG